MKNQAQFQQDLHRSFYKDAEFIHFHTLSEKDEFKYLQYFSLYFKDWLFLHVKIVKGLADSKYNFLYSYQLRNL